MVTLSPHDLEILQYLDILCCNAQSAAPWDKDGHWLCARIHAFQESCDFCLFRPMNNQLELNIEKINLSNYCCGSEGFLLLS